jgi:hypothetical protein
MDRIECLICGELQEDCTCDETPYPETIEKDEDEDLR